MTDKIEDFIKLVQENPDLPIIPMVDLDVVGDGSCQTWLGGWGHSEVSAYYLGKERIHFKDEDQEGVLADMVGCKQYCTPDGRDITEISDAEWDELYKSIPWTDAIIVYITTPDDLR